MSGLNDHQKAVHWIDWLLGGNGFGSDYTDAELNAWATNLLYVLDLPRDSQENT